LGMQIAKEKGEEAKINREPKPLQEFRPKKFIKDYEKYEWSDSDDESSPQDKSKPVDDFTEVTQPRRGDKRNHIKPKPSQNP